MARLPPAPTPSAGETFGHRLRRLRLTRRLNRHALADAVGCSSHSVRNWERDQRVPVASQITSLIRALGVSADYLLTGEECAELQRAILRLEAANAEIAALRAPRRPSVPFRIGQAA